MRYDLMIAVYNDFYFTNFYSCDHHGNYYLIIVIM